MSPTGATLKIKLPRLFERLFGIDVRALAVARIAFATILLVDLGIRATDLANHYSDQGLLPRSALLADYYNSWHLSLHLVSGLWQVEALLFIVAAVCAFLLLIGYRTRWMTFISWLILLSLHNRNELILQGGDVLLRMSLFWAIFLPWGQKFSVDAALDKNKPQPPVITSIASAAILLQVALVYLGSALHKSADIWLIQGNGLMLALHLDQYVTPLGVWLRNHTSIATVLSRSAYILELVAPIALFFPISTRFIRLILVVILIGFHVGINASLKVGLFPWIDIASVIAFIPPIAWNTLTVWLKRRRPHPIYIYYDSECSFCYHAVRLMQTFIVPFNSVLAPATATPAVARAMYQHNSWIIVDPAGKEHFGYEGLQTIIAASPLFHWLSFVLSRPLLKKWGTRAYPLIALHRKTVCEPTLNQLPTRPWLAGLKSFHLPTIFVFVCLVYVIAFNISGYPTPIGAMPASVAGLGGLLRLDQKWNMFSPYPLLDDGWYVIPGILRNGTSVDVFRQTADIHWTKPSRVDMDYPNDRWRKYMVNLWAGAENPARLQYGRFLCRRWNTTHPEEEQLMTFTIYFMLERTSLEKGAPPAPVEQRSLWEHRCF